MRTRQDRWPGWVWRGRGAAGKRDQRQDQRRGGLAAGLSCQDGGVVSADGRRMLGLTASAGRGGPWLEPPVGFAGLLRKLRREARLTQEELAEAAGVSLRAVSYLERGVVTSPQKDTVRLLADALDLIGPARAGFEAAARGRAVPGGVAAATRTLPRDIASFTGRQQELEQLTKAVAGAGGVGGIHAIGGGGGGGASAGA